MKRFFLSLAILLCPFVLAAQTVQHAAAAAQGLTVSATFSSPQAVNHSLIVGVYPPGGTVTDSAGDTFTQDCASATQAVFRAVGIAASAANRITYTLPAAANYLGIFPNEQVGQQNFTVCGSASVTAPGSFNVTEPAGNLVYAMLSSSAGGIGTSPGPGMTVLNGQSDASFWGPNIYSGYTIDAIGVPTGPLFTYVAGLGNGNGQVLTAAYSTVAPITNTVAVSVSATNDDGTVPTILTAAVVDTTPNPTVTELSLAPDPTTGAAGGSMAVTSTESYEIVLYVLGKQVGQIYYDGGPLLALMPNLSQVSFTIVLCKATCSPAMAVKSTDSHFQ